MVLVDLCCVFLSLKLLCIAAHIQVTTVTCFSFSVDDGKVRGHSLLCLILFLVLCCTVDILKRQNGNADQLETVSVTSSSYLGQSAPLGPYVWWKSIC